MSAPRVGIITFGDHRENTWKNVFGKITTAHHNNAVAALKELPIELIYRQEAARTRDQINEQVDFLRQQKAEILIAHTPCWTSPNLLLHGVQSCDLYTIMLGNRDPGSHGCVGLLGGAGALKQIDHPHSVVRGHYTKELFTERMLPLIRAISVKANLKRSVFGHFGGRSIGIDTATFDPMQWRALFGVDSEHIDQVEIIRMARQIDPARIEKMRTWMENNAKSVLYDDEKLTKEKLDFQIACYIATKEIIRQNNIDFAAIKCMPELSNFEVPQCLSQVFLGDSYDGDEGQKKPIPLACEADADGALTQQILQILSGDQPTLFADVSHIDNDRKVLYCVNCGAICAHYACRSQKPEENLAKIDFKRSIRPGGAAIGFFYGAPGQLQLARLYRKNGQYHMAIIPCEAIEPTQEMVDEFVKARGVHQLPTIFAKINFNIEEFTNTYASNHISGVVGNYEKELMEVCKLYGIVPEVFK